jgi:hypothetical protein
MAVLKVIVDILAMLIGAEGARLLREDGAGETPQAQSAEEAPRTAREPHAPGAQINIQVLHSLFKRGAGNLQGNRQFSSIIMTG